MDDIWLVTFEGCKYFGSAVSVYGAYSTKERAESAKKQVESQYPFLAVKISRLNVDATYGIKPTNDNLTVYYTMHKLSDYQE